MDFENQFVMAESEWAFALSYLSLKSRQKVFFRAIHKFFLRKKKVSVSLLFFSLSARLKRGEIYRNLIDFLSTLHDTHTIHLFSFEFFTLESFHKLDLVDPIICMGIFPLNFFLRSSSVIFLHTFFSSLVHFINFPLFLAFNNGCNDSWCTCNFNSNL